MNYRREYERELLEETDRLMEEINHDSALKDVKAPENAFENIMKAIREKEEERSLMEEGERIWAEVEADPDVQNVKVPEDAFENIMKAIREKEEARKIEELSDETKELVRLGKIYKKKRKNKKYFIVTTVMVLSLAFGITCVGGPEKVFEKFKIFALGREQSHVNSGENVKEFDEFSEDQAYQEIEEIYGFAPVKLDYLPEGIGFQEGIIYDETQGIQLIYGDDEKSKITYLVRPNYRDGSLGRDVEDVLVQEYEEVIKDVVVSVKKYLIENNTERYTVQFEYKGVEYFILILDTKEDEVVKIINNLYFN